MSSIREHSEEFATGAWLQSGPAGSQAGLDSPGSGGTWSEQLSTNVISSMAQQYPENAEASSASLLKEVKGLAKKSRHPSSNILHHETPGVLPAPTSLANGSTRLSDDSFNVRPETIKSPCQPLDSEEQFAKDCSSQSSHYNSLLSVSATGVALGDSSPGIPVLSPPISIKVNAAMTRSQKLGPRMVPNFPGVLAEKTTGSACALPPALLNSSSGGRALIQTTDEPVFINRETAAAMNLQNRHDSDYEARNGVDIDTEDDTRDYATQVKDNPNNSFTIDRLVPSGSGSIASTRRRSSATKQSEAWEQFSSNLRKLGLLQPPTCSYLEKRPGGRRAGKMGLLQQLIKQQAEKNGKYVQWNPSKEVSFTSCAEPEVVEATKIISAMLSLRDGFMDTLPDPDSPCVFLPPAKYDRGQVILACVGYFTQGSNEPIFDPRKAPLLAECTAEIELLDGVFHVYWSDPEINIFRDDEPSAYVQDETKTQRLLTASFPTPTVNRFLDALKEVMSAVQHPACKTFCFRRLKYLQTKFEMHLMFNLPSELEETMSNQHRDFYNVRKVDTHVHHSACMHQKQLLRFIRKKYQTEPEEVVAKTLARRPVTLKQIFDDEVGVSAWDASVDLLNVHALGSCFHRFDIFNSKYNPFGQALLREVFLKTDNMIHGRYLAELSAEVMKDLEEQKYQFAEWRLSIYGKSPEEWTKLASWVKENNLYSKQTRWMIQVPRLYHVYRKLNLVQSFGELLRNIFEPLFKAVINPQAHPEIFRFLIQMNGWDSVDDESVVSKYTSEGGSLPIPENWTEPTNPPYSYWAYYMYANIRELNALLASRGMRTLPFRPHCGETGSISHLASMYLLADGINHGIMLRKSPVLQYLYYLQNIGLAVSPLSNNALFHDISKFGSRPTFPGKNPFYTFFACGLNVSLSTDDPLMFHFTTEPLLEEYSCCAVGRNSKKLSLSHFEPQFKRHWLGPNYNKPGRQGNDIKQTNVSNIRVQYRWVNSVKLYFCSEDNLAAELRYLRDVSHLQEIIDELSQYENL